MLVELFCAIDDFVKVFEPFYNQNLIEAKILKRIRKSKLSLSEVMTIIVYYHYLGYKNFKYYYIRHVCKYLKKDFPNLVSYNRFVELMSKALIPLIVYLNIKLGKATGISFIDSTSLNVCHNRRIHSHKVFKGLAQRGKTSKGWFYGFKLHLTINDKGELLGLFVTPGNVDDRNEQVIQNITKNIFGKMYGDKGYVSKILFELLFKRGISLFTKIKKNMENKLMPMYDKLMLKKRALIECVIGQFKEKCNIEHTRHRSIINFFVNIVSALINYTFFEKKPSLNYKSLDLVKT